MNILITGGTGLIGKLLVAQLQSKGHNVRVLKRKKSNNPDDFYWNLEEEFIKIKQQKRAGTLSRKFNLVWDVKAGEALRLRTV